MNALRCFFGEVSRAFSFFMAINRKTFFDESRAQLFGGSLSSGQVEGLNAILDYWENDFSPNTDLRWLAYICATVYHETDKTFQPIEEYGKGRGMRYAPYYGRGLVQLTWLKNYRAMSKAFGVDLVENPRLALNLELAVKILFYGMTHGTFDGKLSDYIKGKKCDYRGARHCVNVQDKANLIAGYAEQFEQILTDSLSTVSPVVAETNMPAPFGVSQQTVENPPLHSPEETAVAENSAVQTTATQTTTEETPTGKTETTVQQNSFQAETKEIPAPEKEGSTKAAAAMTIGSWTVPAFVVTIITFIKSAYAQGQIDTKAVFDALINFFSQNTRYIAYSLIAFIGFLAMKKAFKQISFIVQMIINAVPWLHDIKIVSGEKKGSDEGNYPKEKN